MLIASTTCIRRIPENEKEDFLNYLAAMGILMEKGGYHSPFNIDILRKTGKCQVSWIDKYKKWESTTYVEILDEKGDGADVPH